MGLDSDVRQGRRVRFVSFVGFHCGHFRSNIGRVSQRMKCANARVQILDLAWWEIWPLRGAGVAGGVR